MKTAILMSMLIASPAWAVWQLDMSILRDAVCYIETRGESDPDNAVSPDGKAWGRCQIRYWTAIQYGYPRDRSAGNLFDRDTNLTYALIILHGKSKTLGRHSIRQLISKYGGRGGDVVSDRYIDDVLRTYQSLRMQWWKR